MTDKHAGDRALNRVLARFAGIYRKPEELAAELIRKYLKPRLKGLERGKDETNAEYYLRLMQAFAGPLWALTRRRIGNAVTTANAEAIERINEQLEEAFADGFNDAAYMLRPRLKPMTAAVAAGLAEAGLLSLPKRTLKRKRDLSYNEKRVQSAIHSAIYRGINPEDIPGKAAKTVTGVRQREMTVSARAVVYGAADMGAYYAGREAENLDLEIEKTWIAIMDALVRPSHAHLHGKTVDIDGYFRGYSGHLRYPHDPDAPPEETMNCRCRLLIHPKGKKPKNIPISTLGTPNYNAWYEKESKLAAQELLSLHKRLGRR